MPTRGRSPVKLTLSPLAGDSQSTTDLTLACEPEAATAELRKKAIEVVWEKRPVLEPPLQAAPCIEPTKGVTRAFSAERQETRNGGKPATTLMAKYVPLTPTLVGSSKLPTQSSVNSSDRIVKLKEGVEAAMAHAIGENDPILGLAIQRLYQEGLHNGQAFSSLEAMLMHKATPIQLDFVQKFIRDKKSKIAVSEYGTWEQSEAGESEIERVKKPEGGVKKQQSRLSHGLVAVRVEKELADEAKRAEQKEITKIIENAIEVQESRVNASTKRTEDIPDVVKQIFAPASTSAWTKRETDSRAEEEDPEILEKLRRAQLAAKNFMDQAVRTQSASEDHIQRFFKLLSNPRIFRKCAAVIPELCLDQCVKSGDSVVRT